jgi:WD40 repeat protein
MLPLEGHTGPVLCVAYAPDGRLLASGSWDHTVRLWDTATGEARELHRGDGPVLALGFAPDGRHLAASSGSTLMLWQRDEAEDWTGRPLRAGASVRVLAFTSGGLVIAEEGRGTVAWWSLNGPGDWLELERAPGPPDALIVNQPTGAGAWALALAAGGDHRGEVYLLLGEGRVPGRRVRWRLLGKHSAAVYALAASPDGRILASGSGDHTIKLWDTDAGTELATLAGHAERVLALAFTPDGATLASASLDGVIKLWDLAGRSERAAFDWEIGTVRSVAFAPDGMTAAAGGFDNSVLVWDLE